MSDVLIDDTDPQVRIITLNRPAKRNALSIALLQSLRSAIADAPKGCRVLILRGDGPAFCAGLDLAENAEGDREQSAKALHAVYEASPPPTAPPWAAGPGWWRRATSPSPPMT
jgi:enoyl-CoA hydratase/carnithine racemase